MNNDFPRMVYRTGGTEEIHGGKFSTHIVHDTDELDAALADGWHLTTGEAADAPERERLAREAAARAEEERAHAAKAEALAQAEREAAILREQAEQEERERLAAEERAAAERAVATEESKQDDNAPPTRDELKQKATELGLTFAGNISTEKLAGLVEAALAKG
jgi:ATPase subunit of ABC transporter with duplicated ATPase domains